MTTQNLGSAALQFVAGAVSMIGLVGGIIGITAVFLFAVASAEEVVENDQIIQSFERELEHQTVFKNDQAKSTIEDDELYKVLNSIHWSAPAGQSDALASNESNEVNDSNQDTDLEQLTANSNRTGSSAH